jgi:hypothetical protein
MAKRDQTIAASLRIHGVDCRSDAGCVDIETLAHDAPLFRAHTPQERTQEAQPRLMKAPQSIQPHDRIGWT